MNVEESLEGIYNTLYQAMGPQNWWPADSQFETIIGAILTQSVNWSNVEKAILNLKNYSLNLTGSSQLTPALIKNMDLELLAELIKPSGFYKMKAKKLKAFVDFLDKEYHGDLDTMFIEVLSALREKLLNVYGIGPETADSILLYAGYYPVFVIDAYTKRIFSRIGLAEADVDYHDLQKMLMDKIQPDVDKYNEYHALLVNLGKNFCKKENLDCEKCPLVVCSIEE
ncbi:MAG: endonuclease III domain-containing protein [Halanaerobiaceae bacterium]|nr:endonuclease III domain-containing protein [Halanaerobiaceae bacterium]